ncbi:hypothetical protein [Streptomyces sp. NPDC002205]|uniref:hypothetical protein n=1 Tax=Streptomyces sp. NPDC002205 TaxID=3154411 RepID=UPI003328831F
MITPLPHTSNEIRFAATHSAAFQRGVTALAQYIAREGANKPVPRGHLEPIAIEG